MSCTWKKIRKKKKIVGIQDRIEDASDLKEFEVSVL